MAILEHEIEVTLCNWAEDDGYEVRKLQYVGRRSAPDRMFYRKKGNKGPIFIEFKKPDGKRPVLQRREGERLEAAGVNFFYVDNIQDGCDILGIKNRHAADAHTRKTQRRPRSV